MILDTLEHADRYAIIHPLFAQGFAYLRTFDPSIPDGRHDLAGDRMFALVQSYIGDPEAGRRFESHRRYIDIQYVVTGAEFMGHVEASDLRPDGAFDADRDVGFFHEPVRSTALLVSAGSFAVFFPHDGHKSYRIEGAPPEIRKVVLKIAV